MGRRGAPSRGRDAARGSAGRRWRPAIRRGLRAARHIAHHVDKRRSGRRVDRRRPSRQQRAAAPPRTGCRPRRSRRPYAVAQKGRSPRSRHSTCVLHVRLWRCALRSRGGAQLACLDRLPRARFSATIGTRPHGMPRRETQGTQRRLRQSERHAPAGRGAAAADTWGRTRVSRGATQRVLLPTSPPAPESRLVQCPPAASGRRRAAGPGPVRTAPAPILPAGGPA